MRLHVLGFPHTELTREWEFCAFTARTRVFASMMDAAGWDVVTYAPGPSDARAPHVSLGTADDRARWFPTYSGGQAVFNDFNRDGPGWSEFNARAAAAIRERAKPGDVLCLTMGWTHSPVADALADLRLYPVETGIGYAGVWAPYRVFESYAWRHYLMSREKSDDVRFYDDVIPRAWELEDFPAGAGRGDYALFVGRLTRRKGPHVAADAAKRAGMRLVVAGQGVASAERGRIVTTEGLVLDGDVEYAGVVGPKERAELMGNATVLFAPTLYLEPLGGVVCEAQLAGTPTVTTDHGAFTETVTEGLTGYRCRTLAEFASGARAAAYLDRDIVRRNAIRRWTTDSVAPAFDRYLRRLATLNGAGWYA